MTLIDKAEALAPCPFCGGEANARVWERDNGDTYAGVDHGPDDNGGSSDGSSDDGNGGKS